MVLQNESALYVCELCEKQRKSIRSKQFIENGDSKTSLPVVEFQDFSSDTIPLPQVPTEDGKVCDPYRLTDLAFTCLLSNLKLTDS